MYYCRQDLVDTKPSLPRLFHMRNRRNMNDGNLVAIAKDKLHLERLD